MTTPTLTEAPTPEIFDIIEACLYRIKNFTNVHWSAKSAEQAVAEVGRRLAAAEAEVARLTAALAEAEELAAGPYFAFCDEAERTEYGRRLEPVLDALCEALGEELEHEHEPDEWAAVAAGWSLSVAHGVHLRPAADDYGNPCMAMGSADGWWDYDLRLTVTPDGQPVITAERRAGGAR